jgi:hypothetical protein
MRQLRLVYSVMNPSKQDQMAVVQFLRAEECQTAEIHSWLFAIYGAVAY